VLFRTNVYDFLLVIFEGLLFPSLLKVYYYNPCIGSSSYRPYLQGDNIHHKVFVCCNDCNISLVLICPFYFLF
jgi:hypothetical protein